MAVGAVHGQHGGSVSWRRPARRMCRKVSSRVLLALLVMLNGFLLIALFNGTLHGFVLAPSKTASQGTGSHPEAVGSHQEADDSQDTGPHPEADDSQDTGPHPEDVESHQKADDSQDTVPHPEDVESHQKADDSQDTGPHLEVVESHQEIDGAHQGIGPHLETIESHQERDGPIQQVAESYHEAAISRQDVAGQHQEIDGSQDAGPRPEDVGSHRETDGSQDTGPHPEDVGPHQEADGSQDARPHPEDVGSHREADGSQDIGPHPEDVGSHRETDGSQDTGPHPEDVGPHQEADGSQDVRPHPGVVGSHQEADGSQDTGPHPKVVGSHQEDGQFRQVAESYHEVAISRQDVAGQHQETNGSQQGIVASHKKDAGSHGQENGPHHQVAIQRQLMVQNQTSLLHKQQRDNKQLAKVPVIGNENYFDEIDTLMKSRSVKCASWTLFTKGSVWDPANKSPQQGHTDRLSDELKAAVQEAADHLSIARRRRYTDGQFLDGRYKQVAGAGLVYVLSFAGRQGRVETVRLVRPVGQLAAATQGGYDHRQLVYVVVPYYNRPDMFGQFAGMFEKLVVERRENLQLVVVFYWRGQPAATHVQLERDYRHVAATLRGINARAGRRVTRLESQSERFSRGHALLRGARSWRKAKDVLLFLCDVDMSFNTMALHRCRANAAPGRRVYYPIVFSTYNPRLYSRAWSRPVKPLWQVHPISGDVGYWRDFGYGMTCQYKSDFDRLAGAYLVTNGWGGEDIRLYDKYKNSSIEIVRVPDPDLVHVYHPKICDRKQLGNKYQSCVNSRLVSEASKKTWARHVQQLKDNVDDAEAVRRILLDPDTSGD